MFETNTRDNFKPLELLLMGSESYSNQKAWHEINLKQTDYYFLLIYLRHGEEPILKIKLVSGIKQLMRNFEKSIFHIMDLYITHYPADNKTGLWQMDRILKIVPSELNNHLRFSSDNTYAFHLGNGKTITTHDLEPKSHPDTPNTIYEFSETIEPR